MRRQLGDCVLKQTLEWVGWMLESLHSKDPGLRQTASELLHGLRMKADPVTDEVIAQALVEQYVSLQRWDDAEEVLQTLTEPSQGREDLRKRIPRRRHERVLGTGPDGRPAVTQPAQGSR